MAVAPLRLRNPQTLPAESRSRRAKVRQASIRAAENERACFNGRLESRHRTDDGSEYLHIVFNGDNNEQAKPACRNLGVIDAEFIFLSGQCCFILFASWSMLVYQYLGFVVIGAL